MSVSEKRYDVFNEEDFDFTYKDEVLNNLEGEEYPISASGIKRQIELHAEYSDNGLEPSNSEVEDLAKVDQVIEQLRDKNRKAELDGEFKVYIDRENGREMYDIAI